MCSLYEVAVEEFKGVINVFYMQGHPKIWTLESHLIMNVVAFDNKTSGMYVKESKHRHTVFKKKNHKKMFKSI